jgi:hypothetical protein
LRLQNVGLIREGTGAADIVRSDILAAAGVSCP